MISNPWPSWDFLYTLDEKRDFYRLHYNYVQKNSRCSSQFCLVNLLILMMDQQKFEATKEFLDNACDQASLFVNDKNLEHFSMN